MRSVQNSDKVFLRRADDWSEHAVLETAFHPDGFDIDVCAFVISDPPPFHASNLKCEAEGVFRLGSELRFVGFPHGLSNLPISEGNDWRLGLVRTAYLSGIVQESFGKRWILDGMNNVGYSGGPVFAETDDGGHTILGVISGYRTENTDTGMVYRKTETGDEPTGDFFVKRLNSGFIYAFGRGQIEEAFASLVAPYLSPNKD